MYVDNVITVVSGRAEGHNASSFHVYLNLNALSVIKFDNDVGVSENVVSCSLLIKEIVSNKKILNQNINIGTSLSLLSDTNIINPQNSQILSYDSSTNKWNNSNLGLSGY